MQQWFDLYSRMSIGPNLALVTGGVVLLVLAFGYLGAPLFLWTLLGLASMVFFKASTAALYTYIGVAVLFNIPLLRRYITTKPIMVLMNKAGLIPKISQTERTAIEAGTVWIEGELFSGKPNLKRAMAEPYPELTAEERAFMDNQVNKLCGMVVDHDVWTNKALPEDAWNYLRREKFLGMIIPKEYGGLGFSALAHSEVIMKLATRCGPLAVTVMVPNSLGPAELLNHYGTPEQKKYYLPRLAVGDEIPAFALTEPEAGSDAGGMKATGVVFKGKDGKLYLKLNWNKRWITLASIATVLGLAFKVRDPEKLLGKGEDLGITCALVPTNLPGVEIGKRHDPLGMPFFNCPTHGKDVIVSVDAVVGGVEGIGKGWKMLMECLAAGRGISLPAQSVGGVKLAARAAGDHATIRKQFGVSVGKFEGIEEPMSRIYGSVYFMEAFRRYVLGALDKGLKPAVVTAMAKYYQTEQVRKCVNDGMDIMGGAAISRGPRNILANGYISLPISITVEGANILTRTLMIFGQGALRCHPYAIKEVFAMESNDLALFDKCFWGHIGHVVRNLFRSILLSITRGNLAIFAGGKGSTRRYHKRLMWASASFAIMADLAMAVLGGGLKTKEKITGRFADIFSWMFIATAVLRRFEAEGRRREDLPFLHYSMTHAFGEIQRAFDGLFGNFKVPGLTWFFKVVIGGWSNLNTFVGPVNDDHTHKIAAVAITPSALRDRLTDGIYLPTDKTEALGRLEHAFIIVNKAAEGERKIRKAIKDGTLPKGKVAALVEDAFKKNVITKDDYEVLKIAEAVRYDAIQVDDFTQAEYMKAAKEVITPEMKIVQATGGGTKAAAASISAS